MSENRCTLEASTFIDSEDGEVKAEFEVANKDHTISFVATEDDVLALVVNLRKLVREIRKRRKTGK